MKHYYFKTKPLYNIARGKCPLKEVSQNVYDEKATYYDVEVVLKEGRDLTVCDLNGSSDPYVKFRYANRTIHKSKVICQCLNPVWNEKLHFVTKDLDTPLSIQVYDYDRFASDDFMGSANLHLSPFESNRTYELKLMLSKDEICDQFGCVFIQLLIMRRSENQEEKECLPSSPAVSVQTSARSERDDSMASANYVLTTTVVMVRHLSPGPIGQSLTEPEPYVKLKLGAEKCKTKATGKASKFGWNEKFNFHFSGSLDCHRLEIVVCDRRKDVFLGECKVDLGLIKDDGTFNGWIDLYDGAGQIFITMSLSTKCADCSEANSSNTSIVSKHSSAQVERKYSIRRSLNDIQDVGCLIMTICKAKGLAAADIGGKSDPFCIVELVNVQFQTKTCYKTLNPEWNQTFLFNVKDVYSSITITVYDEDPKERMEFLGKVTIPLIRIRNGQRYWYRLKDAKLNRATKGCIMIEAKLYWNPVRASLRLFQPKERKYVCEEEKFKRRLLMQHINNLKASAASVGDLVNTTRSILNWEKPLHSFAALIAFILSVYFFEFYMIPLALLAVFGQKLYSRDRGGEKKRTTLPESDTEEAEEMEEKKSLRSKLLVVQDTMCTIQNSLGYAAAMLQRIENLFNFAEPFLSAVACVTLAMGFFVLYFVPVRWLVIVWGANKLTKRLRDPTAVQNNELLDLLSRVPSVDEQRAFAESPLDDETDKCKGKKPKRSSARSKV